MYVEMPENDTSIPLTVYGSSINFLPLRRNTHVESVPITTQASILPLVHILPSKHFDVVARARVVRELKDAREPVQAVANRNVDRLAKNAVAKQS